MIIRLIRDEKLVSERPFSASMACNRASSNNVSSGHTAVGLPSKGFEAKVYTWYRTIVMTPALLSGTFLQNI